MEEYNGSIRTSLNPCDIDKDFIDPCFSSLSSKYNIDLEIEALSDDRIIEAADVLKALTSAASSADGVASLLEIT